MNKQKKEVLPSFHPSFQKYRQSRVPSSVLALGLSSGPKRPPCPQGAGNRKQRHKLMAGGHKLDGDKSGQRE